MFVSSGRFDGLDVVIAGVGDVDSSLFGFWVGSLCSPMVVGILDGCHDECGDGFVSIDGLIDVTGGEGLVTTEGKLLALSESCVGKADAICVPARDGLSDTVLENIGELVGTVGESCVGELLLFSSKISEGLVDEPFAELGLSDTGVFVGGCVVVSSNPSDG